MKMNIRINKSGKTKSLSPKTDTEKTETETLPERIEIGKRKSLKRWCYFHTKYTGGLPHPLAVAGLGDTWLKAYRQLVKLQQKEIKNYSLKNKNGRL
jgi:hypothetical protein